MPLPRYASLTELKAQIDKTTEDDNAVLEMFIDGASRFIEGQTGRRFDLVEGETRYFNGAGCRRLFVGDVVSITTVSTGNPDGYTALAVSDWYLGPTNPQPGWPYRWLELPSSYGYDPITNGYGNVFPTGFRTVQLVGDFGWEAVPEDIRNVCVSLAVRAWKAGRAGFNDAIGVDAAGAPLFSKAMSSTDRMTLARYRSARTYFG